jgi:hypothetical protein
MLAFQAVVRILVLVLQRQKVAPQKDFLTLTTCHKRRAARRGKTYLQTTKCHSEAFNVVSP